MSNEQEKDSVHIVPNTDRLIVEAIRAGATFRNLIGRESQTNISIGPKTAVFSTQTKRSKIVEDCIAAEEAAEVMPHDSSIEAQVKALSVTP